MKIIKEGSLPESIEVEETCSRCGTVFSYTQSDVKSDMRNGDYVICPLTGCGAFINSKTLRNKALEEQFRRYAKSGR